MKFYIPCLILFFFITAVQAQKKIESCDCTVLNSPEKPYFSDEKQADSLFQEYISALWKYSKLRRVEDQFMIKEAGACTSPVSMVCETVLKGTQRKNVRLVLYNDYFLKRLNAHHSQITLADKHVLLHELGHHVLGHHNNARSIEALNIPLDKVVADPKLWNKYGADNPVAMEFEADIYAVWALSKLEKGFTVNKLIREFNGKMMADLNKRPDLAKHSTSNHPLFKDRIETMRKFETEMLRKQGKIVARNYFADIASSAYLALWPESYVYDVSISAGTTLTGKPDFSADGEKADAFLYPLKEFKNFHIGLSVSRFRWDKPLQTELDIQYSQHQYGTTIGTTDGKKLAETLRLNYLTFCPKLTWNSIGASNHSMLRSLRFGLFSSIGINARLPIGKVDYTNFIASAPAPESSFSVGPKVSVGAAVLRKSFLPRGFKVLFSYDPQWIRLKATPKPKAISHNLELTLQYSIIRK